MATRVEIALEQVKAVLLGATAAGTSVERGRVDAFGLDELPAINIRRANTSSEAMARGVDQVIVSFDLDIEVRGAGWETLADAIHEEVDGLLTQDSLLSELLTGLRCVSTAADAEGGDDVAGRLTVVYQGKFLQRRA